MAAEGGTAFSACASKACRTGSRWGDAGFVGFGLQFADPDGVAFAVLATLLVDALQRVRFDAGGCCLRVLGAGWAGRFRSWWCLGAWPRFAFAGLWQLVYADKVDVPLLGFGFGRWCAADQTQFFEFVQYLAHGVFAPSGASSNAVERRVALAGAVVVVVEQCPQHAFDGAFKFDFLQAIYGP
jgi:hypothetical protein